MTAKTAWAHLPNARHIDAVLADVRERPEAWRDVYGATQDTARAAAWRAAQDISRPDASGAPWKPAWGMVNVKLVVATRTLPWTSMPRGLYPGVVREDILSAARAAVRSTATDAVIAFVTWDSSADLLECTPDVLRAMIDLAEPPVCHQAALLLPYAIVRFGT